MLLIDSDGNDSHKIVIMLTIVLLAPKGALFHLTTLHIFLPTFYLVF